MPARAEILIVDDQPDNLLILSSILRRHGYAVRQASSGAAALEAVAAAPPDLLLLDVIMRSMDGFEVCERLKADEATRSIPVIFVSGLDEVDSKLRAFSIGGVDYVTKPFQEQEVVARVDTHIRLRAIERSMAAQNEQLALEKRKAQQYLELAGVMFIGIGANGRVHIANRKACEVLRCTEDQIVGSDWFDTFLPDSSRADVRAVFDALLRGEVAAAEYHENSVVSLDGVVRDIAWHNSLHRDESGAILGILSSGEDVTFRRSLEAQVIQAQKVAAVGALAGGIAHDFNNTLAVIMSNVSLATERCAAQPDLRELLDEVLVSVRSAQRVTQQLLTFARGGDPVKTTVDLHRVVEGVAAVATRGQRAHCRLELAPGPAWVEADEGQLGQVIRNVVLNACQAMPLGGVVAVRSSEQTLAAGNPLGLPAGAYVELTVTDQGAGIAPEDLPRIFDPYFTTRAEGSGLGLAVAYSVLNKHGGRIAACSELGLGSTFSLLLPAGPGQDSRRAPLAEIRPRSTPRVLLMDDEPILRKAVARLLASLGAESEGAAEGTEAVALYRAALGSERPFDLVILDLSVREGMGGWETMKELLRLDPAVKAVVSSGYSADPVMADPELHGFRAVLPKPYTKRELGQVLAAVLGYSAP